MIRTMLAATVLLTLTPILNAADRFNIVLVMDDDQGWGDVGY